MQEAADPVLERSYEVGDLAGTFRAVPGDGICVLPVPRAGVVEIVTLRRLVEKLEAHSGQEHDGTAAPVTSPQPRRSDPEQILPVETRSQDLGPLFQTPEAALLNHLRKRTGIFPADGRGYRLELAGEKCLIVVCPASVQVRLAAALAELRRMDAAGS